jgi:eukaryotic-like serine/threonine-protein kinase
MDVGDRISKYQLIRHLGDGAMGVVWAAVNEDTHKEVALKLLASPDPELRRRLLREAKACGRLEHRNIVSVYDAGTTTDGEPFLVMQLLTGDTLGARLRRSGRLAPADAARIAAAIAAGLAAAHAMGIIHRDLKPDNIFLHREPGTPGEVVKIVDFGVSRLDFGGDGAGTATGSIIGSPAYMSPEQARGARDLGPRSDLWSLGVVVFEMLTGTRPFPGATVADVLAQVLVAPVPKIAAAAPHVPGGLCAIVDACLDRDPARRPATAAELAERLLVQAEPSARWPISASVPSLADDLDDDDPTRVADPRNLRAAIAPPAPEPAAPGAPAADPAPPVTSSGAGPPPVEEVEEDDDQRRTAPKSVRTAAPLAAPPAPPPALVSAAPGEISAPPAPSFEAPVFGPATASSTTAPLTRPPAPAPRRGASRPLVVAGSLAAITVSALMIVVVLVIQGQRSPQAPVPVAPAVIESAAPPQAPEPPVPSATAAESAEAPAGAAPEGSAGPFLRAADVMVTLHCNVAAHVYLDGSSIGIAPLAPIHVRLGKHKLTFRHTLLGERVVVVNAKAGAPLVVSVDFGQKAGDSVSPAPTSKPNGGKTGPRGNAPAFSPGPL